MHSWFHIFSFSHIPIRFSVRAIVAIFICSVNVNTANAKECIVAKDYGVVGHTYDIAEKVKTVLINESPTELMEQHKIQIYFDQDGVLTTKLGIKRVPAKVSQDNLKLKITELQACETEMVLQ